MEVPDYMYGNGRSRCRSTEETVLLYRRRWNYSSGATKERSKYITQLDFHHFYLQKMEGLRFGCLRSVLGRES